MQWNLRANSAQWNLRANSAQCYGWNIALTSSYTYIVHLNTGQLGVSEWVIALRRKGNVSTITRRDRSPGHADVFMTACTL